MKKKSALYPLPSKPIFRIALFEIISFFFFFHTHTLYFIFTRDKLMPSIVNG